MAQTPTEAIRQMLADELIRLILALPRDLRASVPEQLLEETGLKKGTRRASNRMVSPTINTRLAHYQK